MEFDFSRPKAEKLARVQSAIAQLESVNIERHRGDGDSMHAKAIATLEALREQREAIIAFPDDEWQCRYEEAHARSQQKASYGWMMVERAWDLAGEEE